MLFWVLRSFDLSDLVDLRRGSGNFFKKYIFEISASTKKMRYVTASWSNFSLNLLTEEVCALCRNKLKLSFSRSIFLCQNWTESSESGFLQKNKYLIRKPLIYLIGKTIFYYSVNSIIMGTICYIIKLWETELCSTYLNLIMYMRF